MNMMEMGYVAVWERSRGRSDDVIHDTTARTPGSAMLPLSCMHIRSFLSHLRPASDSRPRSIR